MSSAALKMVPDISKLPEPKNYLSPASVAALFDPGLKINARWVRRNIKGARRIGSKVFYVKSEVLQQLAELEPEDL